MAWSAATADRRRRAAQRHRAAGTPLTAYFDTSALVKLLVPERGAAEVSALWLGAERRACALVLYPEARAAIGRAERMGRLHGRDATRARRRFEALWEALDRIELTGVLARRAGELADRLGLRAYDAVHLASLEQIADPATTLVSADGDLIAAARAMGFATASVG